MPRYEEPNITWYELDGEEASAAVGAFMDSMSTWRRFWLSVNYALVSMYERHLWQGYADGQAIDGSAEGFFDRLVDRKDTHGRRPSAPPARNVAKAAIDTLSARLFGESPRVELTTDGGDYLLQLQARRKTWALRATLDTMPARRALMQFYRDGLTTGFGVVEPVVRGGSFVLDRVVLEELWWHPREARTQRTTDSPPRTMHRAWQLSKGQVIAMLDELDVPDGGRRTLEERIRSASSTDRERYRDRGYQWSDYDRFAESVASDSVEMITIVRSIRLPSEVGMGDDSDGRELIHLRTSANGSADDAVVLHDGTWTRETLPWVWWTPYPAHYGIIGQGVGHVSLPYQQQIDGAWPRIDAQIRQWGMAKVLYDPGAEGELAAIDTPGAVYIKAPSALGAAMRSMNKPYEILKENPNSDQLLNHPELVAAAMFDALGVNMGVAGGGTKLGANASGAALNAEDTRADIRFADVLLQADAAHVAMAGETLNALDDAASDDPDFRVRFSDPWTGAGSTRAEAYAAIKLDRGSYSVRLEQTGALGRTPAARMRAIQELAQLGAVPADEAMRAIYGGADQAHVEGLANSDAEHVEWQLFYLALNASKGAEKMAPYWPDEVTDLDIADRRSKAEIQRAKREGASDDVIAALTTYRAQVQAERAKKQAAAPAMPPTMPSEMGPSMPADAAALMGGGPVV